MSNILKTQLGTIEVVQIEKMNLLYLETKNDVESQQRSWPEFESKFTSLTGRKMYGLDYGDKKIYRLCALINEADQGDTFGLNQFQFGGGKYLRLRIKHNPPELYDKIGPAYNFLFSTYADSINWELPTIEHYKTHNILDIMIPILNQ